jgi:hypothetical protein
MNNGIYMFRALLAYLQEVLHKNTWYIACVLCLLAALALEWNYYQVFFATPMPRAKEVLPHAILESVPLVRQPCSSPKSVI